MSAKACNCPTARERDCRLGSHRITSPAQQAELRQSKCVNSDALLCNRKSLPRFLPLASQEDCKLTKYQNQTAKDAKSAKKKAANSSFLALLASLAVQNKTLQSSAQQAMYLLSALSA